MVKLDCTGASRRNLGKYCVVAALFVLTMITYVDRVAISTAKAPIASELKLSDSAMGLVFSAFAFGYAVTQIPAGWLADKAGPRAVLAVTVGFWGVLTAVTGVAWSLISLVAIRFLFGVGESAVFPAAARAIRNWLQPGERGRANGALFAGSRLGAAFSYPLLVWMLGRWNWRDSFLILGIAGLAWAVLWLLLFRDYPAIEPGLETGLEPCGELPTYHGQAASSHVIRLGGIFKSRPMVLAMAQYFASNFTNFICLSWMLPYLMMQYHLTAAAAAVYSMAPLLLGATSQGITGWLIDRMYHSPLRAWSRRLPAIVGFSLAAAALLGVARAGSAGLAVLSFTVAIFGADMTISPSWVFCADLAGRNTGGVSGAMNMLGNIGAFVSANAFPYLKHATGSASAYFVLAAVLNVFGIVCWFQMRSAGDLSSAHKIEKLERSR